ncbi:hypothetical protein TIFTF001_019923 [Ficus carica]|uniref:Uncharacterized protein n=1 Tax=Ficus carica TaxID=3494 RepID=A0AA88DC53_FICCA|nr:hypothetical protein TIFTF001_019923 [Ficus carica]
MNGGKGGTLVVAYWTPPGDDGVIAPRVFVVWKMIIPKFSRMKPIGFTFLG